jgi:hypothetical protein
VKPRFFFRSSKTAVMIVKAPMGNGQFREDDMQHDKENQ